MDDIGTRTPAPDDAAVPRERIDPAAARPRTTIIGAVLGSVAALLLIAAAIYYLAGRDAGTEVASGQQPREAAERPAVATAPAPSKSAENPPPPAAAPPVAASPPSPSAAPPPQPAPPQQSAAPAAPPVPTPPASQAEATASTPPAAVSQQPTPMSDRATALPGNDEVLFVRAPRANIRSEPSRTGRVIGTAVKGSQVKVIGRSKNWVEVETDAGKGWIGGSLLGSQSPGSR